MHNIVPRQIIDYINVTRFKVSYILVVNYDPIFACIVFSPNYALVNAFDAFTPHYSVFCDRGG